MTSSVQDVFWENRRRYGSRRVQKALNEQGIEVGRHQVRRLMKRQNWQAIQPRSFVPRTTDSRHGLQACPNRLLELGQPIRPNQAWPGRRCGKRHHLPAIGRRRLGLFSQLARPVLAPDRRLVCRCNNGRKLDYQGFRPSHYIASSTARLDCSLRSGRSVFWQNVSSAVGYMERGRPCGVNRVWRRKKIPTKMLTLSLYGVV